MVVHSINIFDKRGKILYSKAYSPVACKQERYLIESGSGLAEPGTDPVTEQKKLLFGMLFSLRELVGNLTPEQHSRKSLQAIKTASTTVHTFETLSGLRFALYTSNDVPTTKLSEDRTTVGDYATVERGGVYARDVLVHIYSKIWVECVVRSPLYVNTSGDAVAECIKSTTFEKELYSYLSSLPWFR